MGLLKYSLGVVVVAGGLAALPASAQVSSTVNAGAGVPVSAANAARDPNRVVCVKEDVIGSRLGSKRVCRTAAQWTAYRAEIRGTTERMQNGKYSKEGPVVGGF